MAIPQKYQIQNNSIATYDYFDLANKFGYKEFYGFTQDGSTYSLIPYRADSQQAFKTFSFAASGFVLRGTITLDYTCTKAMTLFAAPGYFNATVQDEQKAAVNNDYARIDMKIDKVSGATTSTVVSLVTGTQATWTDDGDSYRLGSVFSVPQTHFKEGDILRLVIYVYLGVSWSGGTAVFKLWTDGGNRNMTSAQSGTSCSNASDIRLTLPIRIDE